MHRGAKWFTSKFLTSEKESVGRLFVGTTVWYCLKLKLLLHSLSFVGLLDYQ
eukprot:COSAG02_NODE_857_length_16462_cov_4.801381_21_plen_52_part_00